MKDENVKIDTREMLKQFRKDCEENGLTFKVYMPYVEMRDMLEGFVKKSDTSFCAPNVEIKGHASPVSIALLIWSIDKSLKEFKDDPQVQKAEKFLKFFTKDGETIDVGGDYND